MDLYYETTREMLSLDEMLEGDLKFCLDEMEPELKDLNWSGGGGLDNLTNWGSVNGSGTGGDYWSANCWTLSGQQDHKLPAFDLTLTPENTPANKMVNPKSVIPSRIRSMQFEFEMEMMANGDNDSDDDEDEDQNRTIHVDDIEKRVSREESVFDRSFSPSGNEEEDESEMRNEPMDEDDDVNVENLENSLDDTNEAQVKLEEDEDVLRVVPPKTQSVAKPLRTFQSFQKPVVKQSTNLLNHEGKQVVKAQMKVQQRPAQGGKPRTLWLLKQQPVKQGLQTASPEKDVERIIKTQTVTNPNGVQILKPNLQKLRIISSAPDSPQQVFLTRSVQPVTSASSPPPVASKIINGSATSNGTTGTPVLHIGGRTFQKPPCSYSCLIVMALKNSETGYLPVSEIYNFMCKNFPFFQCAPPGWKNSVRHNLSMNDCFAKIEKDPLTVGPSSSPPTSSCLATPNVSMTLNGNMTANGGLNAGNNGGGVRKGCLWTMNPDKVSKMDDELAKWSRKDPDGMRGAMRKPSDLDKLIKGELVIRTSGTKLEVKSEDEDDECDNDEDVEEEEKSVPVTFCRPEPRTQVIMPEDEGVDEEEEEEEAGDSDDDSDSSSDEDDVEEEGELYYDSDSDEDRVPPSLKPFVLRQSLDPLSSSPENNNKTKIVASRLSSTNASAPKRPRLLSHPVKYVPVAKSGLVTTPHRLPMRML